MSEDNRVEAFISGLRHYRSHFLITKPSTMEEVRQIVVHITRKRQWNTDHRIDSDSDSNENSDSTNSSSANSSSDKSMKKNEFIKMKNSTKKKNEKQGSFSNPNKKELSEIDN